MVVLVHYYGRPGAEIREHVLSNMDASQKGQPRALSGE